MLSDPISREFFKQLDARFGQDDVVAAMVRQMSWDRYLKQHGDKFLLWGIVAGRFGGNEQGVLAS